MEVRGGSSSREEVDREGIRILRFMLEILTSRLTKMISGSSSKTPESPPSTSI